MQNKTVYILLTDTGTLLTKLIKSYTKKPYNHASIAFDANLHDVYSFGRKVANNPLIGGFVKEDIHCGLFIRADCAIYSLSVTNVEFQRMYHYIRDLAANKEKYTYNFLGLFGIMINLPLERKDKFFCSQFVATVLSESNVVNFEKDLSLIKPSDLPLSSDFQLIYEGRLADYPLTAEKKVRMGKTMRLV